MANKRQRPSGTWEYTVKRAGMLPKPLSLTFDTEEEGDAYVARLEQLLDAGILPEEVAGRTDSIMNVDDAIRSYLRRVSVPSSDVSLLNAVLDRLKGVRLATIDFKWAERWVTGMKRIDNLSPSTIRHYVGALARCLDWTIKTGTPALVTNPLRSLPTRYATYTDDDRKAVVAQNLVPKNRKCGDSSPAGSRGTGRGLWTCRTSRRWFSSSNSRSSRLCGCGKYTRSRRRNLMFSNARRSLTRRRTAASAQSRSLVCGAGGLSALCYRRKRSNR